MVFHALLLSAAGMVWAERKVAARLQQRFGPTLAGPAGLLQPFADVFKLFFKEELKPKAADSVAVLPGADHLGDDGVSRLLRRAVRPPTTLFGLLDGRCR